MPSTTVQPATIPSDVDIAELKAKQVNGHIELEQTVAPPVDDNYMYDFRYNHSLPTIDSLGIEPPQDVDVEQVAGELASQLSDIWSAGDADAFAGMFLDYGVWRDKLVFTWDYRTFNFKENITRAAHDLLPTTRAHDVKLITPRPNMQRPYPDLAYIQFAVSFSTHVAHGSAVAHAVLTTDGWRLWTIHTSIEGLVNFPEADPTDGHMVGTTSWESQRAKEDDEIDPEVVIVGGGQNGLQLAARLKALGVRSLIIERNPQIGEIWRNRYEYLSLHLPHWADHFAYMPFPEKWPIYTPAQKLGIFMEWYAHAMELAVWTNSAVLKADVNQAGQWTVQVNKDGKDLRTLKPKHVVMATSLCGVPLTPVVPGLSEWKGVARHSTDHVTAKGFKRVLVVGTSSSGFDTAYECSRLGIQVDLLQRSPTYVMSLTHSVQRMLGNYAPNENGIRPDLDEQDRAWFSMPTGPAEELGRRNAAVLEDLDKDMLAGLNKAGFKTWRGQRGTGNGTLGMTKNGGFYFDAGCCKEIAEGRVKVIQGTIERFTTNKVILSGGREREYDLVVFATGFSNTIDSIRSTLGEDIASQVRPIWGVDEEGEFKTAFKESGVENLWILVGFLASARYQSKRLALRIKALLAGVASTPYTS